jgi:hypothetical protein
MVKTAQRKQEPISVIDTRLRISDPELCKFVRDFMAKQHRNDLNGTLIHMLYEYAASQYELK